MVVVNEGRKALKAAAEQYGFNMELTDYDFGGDRYLRTGEILPENAVDELRGLNPNQQPRASAKPPPLLGEIQICAEVVE